MEQDRRKVGDAEAEEWVVPMRPVPAERAFVPSAAGKRRIPRDSPAIGKNAPIVAQTWCESKENLKEKGERLCQGEMEPVLSVSGR